MWPTAWCSTAEVTIRWPRALPAQAAPLSARLFASVPPEVKTISRASAFRRAATRSWASSSAARAGAPEAVRRARVAERLGQERQHRVEDLAPERGRRRVVEVDRHGRDCTPRPSPAPADAVSPIAVRRPRPSLAFARPGAGPRARPARAAGRAARARACAAGSTAGVTSTSSSAAMNSIAVSSVIGRGGVSRSDSSCEWVRMLVSFFSLVGLTSMSPDRLFSPTIIPS